MLFDHAFAQVERHASLPPARLVQETTEQVEVRLSSDEGGAHDRQGRWACHSAIIVRLCRSLDEHGLVRIRARVFAPETRPKTWASAFGTGLLER